MTRPVNDELRARWRAEADLQRKLCEHIWSEFSLMHLAGGDWENVYEEDIPPAYKDDADVVLLRRKSDGRIFEAVIDVTLVAVKEATS